MKIKTSELQGKALDWTVAQCEGVPVNIFSAPHLLAIYHQKFGGGPYKPSESWEQAGPIIDREHIDLSHQQEHGYVTASIFVDRGKGEVDMPGHQDGPTALIAAMRAYVQSKLGDEVEVPGRLA
jgi:hypothetical protein